MLVLKIAGLVLLGLVLIIVIGVYLFIRKIKKSIGDAAAGLNTAPPIRITLAPESNPEWRSAEQINTWTEEFKKLGFEVAGTYSIPEMNGLMLRGFCHPGESFYGVIYDHLQIPPSFDITCRYEDGTSLTGASTTFGETTESYPLDEKIRIDTTSVAQVFDAVMKGLKGQPRVKRAADQFAADFLRAYKEETYWRIKKGGASRDEIRKQAQKDGMQVTDEDIENVYTSMREQYVYQLGEACIAQYLDDSRLSVVEWQQLEDRAFAVPETLEWKEVVELLEGRVDADEEQMEELNKLEFPFGTNALEMIDQVIARNVAGLKLEKKGEVQEPVRAYILLTPP